MNILTRIAARILSNHAHRTRRKSIKETARQIRSELRLPPLKALKP